MQCDVERGSWPRLVGIVAALLGLALTGAAQGSGGPRVSAHLSSGVVKLGADVQLVVTVENSRDARLGSIPAVDGLRIGPVGAPSVTTMENWVNGRRWRSQERTWVVPVRPTDLGDFTIPPIEVVVDGDSKRTQPLALTVVADLRGEELGWFEMRASSTRVVEGQPFSIELRFGWDQALQQKINYANLSLPWWDQLPGALEMEADPSRPGAVLQTIYLNSQETIEVEEIDPVSVRGRAFRAFRVVRSFTPTRPGKLELPTSFLEFGRTERSRDFFSSRRRKTESYYVRAEALTIDVMELPEEGRPLDFSGAIGTLTAKATAEPRDIDLGESIKLTVEWSGNGNLEFFRPPDPARIEAFGDFRVYGSTDKKEFDRRQVTYDIAPDSSRVTEIPPLPLTVYDSELGRYTTIETEPIEIRVRPLEGAEGLASEERDGGFGRDVLDIVARPRPRRIEPRPGPGVAAGVLAGVPIAWLGLRTLVRRKGDPDAPKARRRRRARATLARALGRADGARGQLDALHAFLADRTGATPEAWNGRELDELTDEYGVPREHVEELRALVAELEGAAWGTGTGAVERARVLRVADGLIGGGL